MIVGAALPRPAPRPAAPHPTPPRHGPTVNHTLRGGTKKEPGAMQWSPPNNRRLFLKAGYGAPHAPKEGARIALQSRVVTVEVPVQWLQY